MAISSGIDFTLKSNPTTPGAAAPAKEKTKYWVNVGLQSNFVDEESGKPRFVSLSLGIPLDSIKPLATNSKNRDYALFNASRNDLYEQIMAAAEQLAPGEDRLLNLQVQLRHVEDELAPADADESAFKVQLVL